MAAVWLQALIRAESQKTEIKGISYQDNAFHLPAVLLLTTCLFSSAHTQAGVTPSPDGCRVFVTHYWDETLIDYWVTMSFRWSALTQIRDLPVDYYEVFVGSSSESLIRSARSTQPYYEIQPAPKDAVLYFKVRACSRTLCGSYSTPVVANTSVPNPPPKLVLITPGGATLFLPDTGDRIVILKGSVSALTLTSYDDAIYWVDDVSHQLYAETGQSKTALTMLQDHALNMAVDWIGRHLFVLTTPTPLNQCNYVRKYDLSRPNEPVAVVLTDEFPKGRIHYIQVDPFQSVIYYTYSQPNESRAVNLMRSDYHGKEAQVIMGLQVDHVTRGCECVPFAVHSVFALDPRPDPVTNISIYVFDTATWNVWGLDPDGCKCHLLWNSSSVSDFISEFPPLSVTVDHSRLYWINNQSSSVLCSVKKNPGQDLITASGVSMPASAVIGHNILPLPERGCLMIKSFNYSISLLNSSADSLALRLSMSLSPRQPCGYLSLPSIYFILEYSEMNSGNHRTTQYVHEPEVVLTGLQSYSYYEIRIGATNYFVDLWKNHTFSSPVVFQTKPESIVAEVVGNSPGPPGIPRLIDGDTDKSGPIIEWSVPTDHEPVDLYQLICRNPEAEVNSSVVCYTGSDAFCRVVDLNHTTLYVCQARAKNKNGWGPFSNWSSEFFFQLPYSSQESETAKILKLVLIPLFVILVFIFITASVIFVCRKVNSKFRLPSRGGQKIDPQQKDEYCLRSLADDEESKKLYAINLAPAIVEVSNTLPHFCRDQLEFSKFVCECSWGDIFEGLAKDILGRGTGFTPVLIKTINSHEMSDQEAEDLMKEVVLMNQMRQRNIISLLGVSFKEEPQLLIFELPIGGDLLTFLHLSPTGQQLNLKKLSGFCLDIARGCQFFEERHMVHRDIRARNCFVFHVNSTSHFIKIGGFCLLRDIGSIMVPDELPSNRLTMPLKWMAPEAITNQLFTIMSDVWAFGILMWEIFTMGDEPYPDRVKDSEVVHFVQNGGRLNQPANCPPEIYSLMLSCWYGSPFKRPSFHFIVDQLEKITDKGSKASTNE